MALNQYISDTQLLCHDTNGVFASQSNYTTWINEARSWIAGECMCVRQLIVNPTVTNQEIYTLPTSAVAGVGQALGVLPLIYPHSPTEPGKKRFR